MYNKLIAITNRHLCEENMYFAQIGKIVSCHPNALILREKDLTVQEYRQYAMKVKFLCEKEGVPFYIHSHVEVAKELGCDAVHFSIPKLREYKDVVQYFQQISVSCHSLEDAREAQELGATRIVLGNIFETDCKKGLPGKGLQFLQHIAEQVEIPVYAIGGISLDNLEDVIKVGAAGGCMMSGFMKR